MENGNLENLQNKESIAEHSTDNVKPAGHKQEDIQSLKIRLKELEDQNLRIRAEFSNYKKRTQKEKADWARSVKKHLFQDLLDIYDDIDRCVSAGTLSSAEKYCDAVKMIKNRFDKFLEQNNITKHSENDISFDYIVHEAVGTVPANNKADEDTVEAVLSPGFSYNGELVRPAKVIVRKYSSG